MSVAPSASASARTPSHDFRPLASLIDQSGMREDCRPARDAFRAAVHHQIAQVGVVHRPASLAELLADPVFPMKYREKPAHRTDLDDARWEGFALSLGDCERTRLFADLLPALAVLVRLERDPVALDHLRRQLAELATWSPLMRSGWSSGTADDGAWLGTGWAVRAIYWTLALLPAGTLDPALVTALDARLLAEARGIRDDWRTRRNWFIRDEAVHSNQWVLPLEALLLACVRLGVRSRRDDYEFAVAGLLRSLDAQGPDGEFVEGMEYGAITLHAIHSAARAAAETGDRRLLDHPFLRAFPLWYLHHRQPAGQLVNAFDSRVFDLDDELLARAVTDLGHSGAAWVLERRPAHPATVFALAARPLLALHAQQPPLFAAYPVAARVNWLESPAAFLSASENLVSGFWMRGGHATDAHDHQDRGHVNFIVRGRPVLIEAGLASYGVPDHRTHYLGVAGHNVLQIGAHAAAALTRDLLDSGAGQILDAAHRAAPLAAHRLDATGGLVEFDGSRCYAGLVRWKRRVEWDTLAVSITDDVELGREDTILFRWHLGVDADAHVTPLADGLQVGDIVVRCSSEATTAPIRLSVESMPEATRRPREVRQHATVVVQSAEPVRSLVLHTHVSLAG